MSNQRVRARAARASLLASCTTPFWTVAVAPPVARTSCLTVMRCMQTQAQVVHGHEVLVTKITVRACIFVVAAVAAVKLPSRYWRLTFEKALCTAVAKTASRVLKLIGAFSRYMCLYAVWPPAQAKRDREIREEAPPRRHRDWAQGHCAHDQDTSRGCAAPAAKLF